MARLVRHGGIVLMVVLTLDACHRHGNDTHGSQESVPEPTSDSISYAGYAAVLSEYVSGDGLVDYAGLTANRTDLDAFIAAMANLKRGAYDVWDESEKIAFWLNAYNALTLVAIADHYPIEPNFFRSLFHPGNSIRQIPGVWTDLEWHILGDWYTLSDIEHQVLRRDFDEPRIHAALVCASMGCPPLLNEPYRGEVLDAKLDNQMKRFVSDPAKFRIDRNEDTVYLSPIFNWFGQDFVDSSTTDERIGNFGIVESAVLSAIARYVSPEDAKYLRGGGYRLEYLKYDWSLNEEQDAFA